MSVRDEGAGVRWALRRYAWLVAAVVLLTMLLSLLVAQALRRNVGYTATALVIATELQVRQEQLPRFGESVFNGGSVARAVAGTAGADYRTLVPEKISMDPVSDTIAFRVQGHADDPQEAARLANSAAGAFVAQLNKAGAGVGKFSLQDPAFVPLERDLPTISYPLAAVIGLAGGSILAVALVAMLLGLRRPLLNGQEAADAVGAPLVSVVTLPRRGKGNPRGVRTVLESMPALPSTAIELAGPAGSRGARKALLTHLPRAATDARARAAGSRIRRVTVMDLHDEEAIPLELVAPPLEDDAVASVLVVVQEGAARRRVADLAEDFPDDEIGGVVFVRRRRRLRPEGSAEQAVPAVDLAVPPAPPAPVPPASPPSPSSTAVHG